MRGLSLPHGRVVRVPLPWPEEAAEPVPEAPGHDVDVEVGHALADAVVDGDERAVGPEGALDRVREPLGVRRIAGQRGRPADRPGSRDGPWAPAGRDRGRAAADRGRRARRRPRARRAQEARPSRWRRRHSARIRAPPTSCGPGRAPRAGSWEGRGRGHCRGWTERRRCPRLSRPREAGARTRVALAPAGPPAERSPPRLRWARRAAPRPAGRRRTGRAAPSWRAGPSS